MATRFLNSGGDEDFLVAGTTSNGFWFQGAFGSPTATIATDFVHGGHKKSLKYAPNTFQVVPVIALTGAGSRMSFYIYISALPNATATISQIGTNINAGFTPVVIVKLTSGGVLQLTNSSGTQIGSNGATLSTGRWYRLCFAYTITSTTVNEFRLFVDSVSSISVSNATINSISVLSFWIGNYDTNTTLNFRSSDHYIDDTTSLADTGNIWVTAKRPVSNGTTNGFTTQIGAGGSGYGSGHSPQVNERALSTTNGWSMVGAGAAVTEEYNIEAKNVGDIDISTATIVDWLGWASMKALAGETLNMIIDGASVAQAITTTTTLYTKIKGSATYPSGTGADIGITTDTSLTTVSLYECGVLVAYIPSAVVNTSRGFFNML